MKYEEMIKKIEQFISANPELKKAFNKNIKHRFTIEFIGIEDKTKEQEIYRYDYDKNKIIINIKKINKITSNEEEYDELINYALLCGLLQMSSTTYKRGISESFGFGEIQKGIYSKKIKYEGLTAGYTELLASEILNRKIEQNPNFIIIMISKQLELIIGKDKMLKAYFGRENKDIIKNEIRRIEPQLPVDELLELRTTIQNNINEGIETYQKIFYVGAILENLLRKKISKQQNKQQKQIEILKEKIKESMSQTPNIEDKKTYIKGLEQTLKQGMLTREFFIRFVDVNKF